MSPYYSKEAVLAYVADLHFLDDKTYELLKRISPLEPLKRHDDIKATRVDNTGTWLLKLPSFCEWSDSAGARIQKSDRVFCCYGIPGAGKTVMR